MLSKFKHNLTFQLFTSQDLNKIQITFIVISLKLPIYGRGFYIFM